MNFFNMFNQGNANQFNQFQNNRSSNVDNTRLYKLLGIDKDSDEKTIKKAYLKKSMTGDYRHPDKGGSNEKFQELSMAYNTLKDKKKRELYNKFGEDSLKSDFQEPINMNSLFNFQSSQNPNRLEKGQPIIHRINVTLEELCNGCTKKIKITRDVIIDSISNQIVDENELENICSICKFCNGSGFMNITRQIGPGMIQQIRTTCKQCNGNSRVLKPKYRKIKKEEILNIFIEKGSENGEKIKLNNKGNMQPGKLTSDIIIILNEIPHKIFQRKGNDLLIKRKISLLDAICGFKFLFKHLDNRFIVIKSNDVIKDKEIKCIDNGGMPIKSDTYSYGKLFVIFTVVYPKINELNSEIKVKFKKLFQEIKSFKSLNNNNVEDKLKSLPENSEIDYETLIKIDPKLYGKKNNSKSANDSDSEDEGPNVERCHTM